MGGAAICVSGGAMGLYYYASMDRHDDITNEVGRRPPRSSFKYFLTFINRRDNTYLAIFGLWLTTCEVSVAIGHLCTNPSGNTSAGWFYFSAIFWFNPPFLYFARRFHNILSQMSPSDISSYLSTNILAIGISSITPMIYLSMDTNRCVIKADHAQNVIKQCSGVLYPQMSICVLLLIMMGVKVIIAPLFPTTMTADDLIKLNVPRRLIFQGVLFGISFLLNLYLFANMEEGNATVDIIITARTAILLATIPLSLEIFHMIFHHAHRTSLALPPQRSLSFPPSSEISLSPTDSSLTCDPTDGSATNAFV